MIVLYIASFWYRVALSVVGLVDEVDAEYVQDEAAYDEIGKGSILVVSICQ